MRSLGELGIGLSVVFCVFVLVLVAELCYIFYWKKSKLAKPTSADCLKSATEIRGRKKFHRSTAEFVREASLVGSFGGYPCSLPSEVGGGSNASSGETLLQISSSDPPPHLLFSIKEETKEDMELATGLWGTLKPNSRLRSRTPSDVLTIHFTSGSSSPAASVDTPFTTPPSSPPPTERLTTMRPKLSPFAACAVRPMSCASPIAEMRTLSGCSGPSSPATNGQQRTSLRLLFERSPVLGARPQSPAPHPRPSPLQSTSLSLPCTAAESFNASLPPVYNRRISLATLFRQSSTPCLPFSTSN